MSADVRCCRACGSPLVEFLPGRPFCACPDEINPPQRKEEAHDLAAADPEAWGWWDIAGGESGVCPACLPECIDLPENDAPGAIHRAPAAAVCGCCSRIAP